MSRTLVSVVVLRHNCPGLLERALVSVSSQVRLITYGDMRD